MTIYNIIAIHVHVATCIHKWMYILVQMKMAFAPSVNRSVVYTCIICVYIYRARRLGFI